MAYLDHAADTPMLPESVVAMTAALGVTGNASAAHASGRRARRKVEESRERVAADLGAHPLEVIFTSGGTESANLAVKGIYRSRRQEEPGRRRVILSKVEHHAVLDSAAWLAEHEQAQLVFLDVDESGRVHPGTLKVALEADGGPGTVALVTVMWANNEVGTIMPVSELAAICRAAGVPLHTDAVQALGHVPVDFAAAGVDALSLSGHKFGGPGGAGALLLRLERECLPLLHGGGQERGLRSGSLDVAGAVGLAAAVEAAHRELEPQARRTAALRDALVSVVRDVEPEVRVNGDPDPSGSLPGHAHLTFPGCDAQALVMLLDAAGVECSAGSACAAGLTEPSYVLTAMGRSVDDARSSLRFTLGHTSQEGDVAVLRRALPEAVARARATGSSSPTGSVSRP